MVSKTTKTAGTENDVDASSGNRDRFIVDRNGVPIQPTDMIAFWMGGTFFIGCVISADKTSIFVQFVDGFGRSATDIWGPDYSRVEVLSMDIVNDQKKFDQKIMLLKLEECNAR